MKETLQANFFWMQVQCQYALKKFNEDWDSKPN